ncbi:MAG: glycosyltransferase, partial [Vicinamibacterales bacterium]
APVDGRLRLVIAGKVKQGWGEYWRGIQAALDDPRIRDRVVPRIQFIADEEIEQYFKAADVLVLPYTDIFQSGVLFLAYSFGLPVIVTDVGSLRESVIEGKTGLVCPPRDPSALARTIERYFATDIYGRLDVGRDAIRQAASSSHSWAEVSEITEGAYVRMLPAGIRGEALRA